MSNVGYATLTIIPTAKGFVSALSKEVGPDLDRVGRSGGSSMGGSLMGAFKGLVGPAMGVAGVAAMGSFVKGTIAAASGLNESANAIRVSFGDAAGGVEELGRQAAQSLGLSNLEFNNLAVRFSSFSKTIAGPGGDVTKTLDDLTTRASDFASVMNLDVAKAAELFQSGLAGETEPLRAYGIDLSAAAVENYALANGIAASAGSMTEAEKVQARYGLLMQSTTAMAGDFANTSDQLANQQRILSSEWANVQGILGQAFLPALTGAVGALNGMMPVVAAGATAFRDWFLTLGDSGALDVLGGFLAELGGAFSGLLPQIMALLPAFSPLGLVLQALMPVLPQIADLVVMLAGVLGSGLAQVLALVTPLIGQLVSTLSGVFIAIMPTVMALVSALASAFSALVPVVMSILAAVLPLITTLVGALAPIFIQLVNSIMPPVIAIIGALVPVIETVVGVLMGVLIPVIEALLPVVVTVFGVIADIIGAAMVVVQGVIEAISALIRGDWEGFWAAIGDILSGVWDLIVSVVSGAIAIVSSVIGAAMDLIGDLWTNGWNAVGDWLGGVWDGIVNTVTGWVDGLVGMGQDMMQGLIDGISDMAGGILDAIMGPISGAVDAVKDFLGIHSPSRLFIGIGEFTGEGMAIGLRRSAGLIADASEALIPTAPSVPRPGNVPEGGVFGAASGARGRGDVYLEQHIRTDDDPRLWARGVGDELTDLMAGAR